jgi:ankyrin repeat protein
MQEALYDLCEEKQPSKKKLDQLLQEGADLEFTYADDDFKNIITPLMLAIKNNSPTAELMLKHSRRIHINRTNIHGETPLMYAIMHKNMNAISALCRNKNIQINKQDNYGNTALMHCLINYANNPETTQIISLLLAHGAEPEIENKDGVSPLNFAKNINDASLINLLKKQ